MFFWVLLGSSGVLLAFFCVLLAFFCVIEHQKNARRTPEEHQKRNRRHVRYCRYTPLPRPRPPGGDDDLYQSYKDIEEIGLPLLQKTIEIFLYFQPKYWIIENPATGKMKNYLSSLPQHVVSYCKYANWGYKKPTSIFTNIKGF